MTTRMSLISSDDRSNHGVEIGVKKNSPTADIKILLPGEHIDMSIKPEDEFVITCQYEGPARPENGKHYEPGILLTTGPGSGLIERSFETGPLTSYDRVKNMLIAAINELSDNREIADTSRTEVLQTGVAISRLIAAALYVDHAFGKKL